MGYDFLMMVKNNSGLVAEKIKEAMLPLLTIVTSKEITASKALDIYRKRDSIEKIFRMLKTGLEYDTSRVHSQTSLESKTYVMFIASIIINYIFQGLKEVGRREKDKRTTLFLRR